MSGSSVPAYVRQLSMEATFRDNDNKDICIYGYVTYDKTKLKGPQIDKLKQYNLLSHGKIPITENEFLDMALITDKNDKRLDFHMTYVRHFSAKDDTPLTRSFQQPIKALNVRSDIGPHIGDPHIDVEVFDMNGNKIFSNKEKQVYDFTNYEFAISAVFIQVEKLSNPLIGAQYWLSPIGIFKEGIDKLAQLRKQSKILTSLNVLSRMINVKAYEKTRDGSTIDETEFWKVVDSQIHLAREKEKEVGGALDFSSEIPYSTKMSKLPFLFFEPAESERYFKGYRCDGSELGSDLRLFGVANERKDGINFIRDLDSNERNVSHTP